MKIFTLNDKVGIFQAAERYKIVFEMLDKCNKLSEVWDYYPWGSPHVPDKETLEDEKFCYPGDPKLEWLLKVSQGDEVLYFYGYDMTAYTKGGKFLLTGRMD